MTSAQIDEPPSPAKRDLIRRYLLASGLQHRVDRGRFLESFAIPGTPIFAAAAEVGLSFGDAMKAGLAALSASYDPHRATWRQEYERHLNWEYTEQELESIVAFLESPVGQHYLEGSWRMDAYTGTNVEHLMEQIAQEAEVALRSAKP